MTMVEILLVLLVIMVLVALLMPAVSMIRQRAARQEAAQVTAQLTAAVRVYATDDLRHRFPLQEQLYPAATLPLPHAIGQQPVGAAVAGVFTLLLDIDAGVRNGDSGFDDQGRLLDPWGTPYNYQLTRPTPTTPADALRDWNWDAAANRAKGWNAVADAPAPFPYIWSYGRRGTAAHATTWIYEAAP